MYLNAICLYVLNTACYMISVVPTIAPVKTGTYNYFVSACFVMGCSTWYGLRWTTKITRDIPVAAAKEVKEADKGTKSENANVQLAARPDHPERLGWPRSRRKACRAGQPYPRYTEILMKRSLL